MIENYLFIHLSRGYIDQVGNILSRRQLGTRTLLSISFAFSRRHWRNVCAQLERFSIYSILHLYLSLPGT